MVRVVSTHDEFKKILGSASPQQLVVVDFTAAWCGPCQSIAPVYEELSKKYPQTLFLKVDVDENRDTAVANEIQAMPTFLFFKASKKIHALKGADPARLEAAITQHSGDSWTSVGQGHTLGASSTPTPATTATTVSTSSNAQLSDRELRLRALEARLGKN
eukprot:c4833_g1_i2.p1 GENE.c4833_g1_i2~~c4833_g1_i2.p1  ORF type:complete len:176 (+),score=44.41 c4833_g1_i2:50-529(+)